MEGVRKEVCRECGESHPRRVAGANQPVRAGDMLLAFKAQGLHVAAGIMMDRIVAHDKDQKK